MARNCNCSDFPEEEFDRYFENGRLVEYSLRCTNCKRRTATWSYGTWFERDGDQ